MANITERFIEIGDIYLEITYDDVTLNLVSLHLYAGSLATIVVYKPNGTEWRRIVMQPGTDQVVTFPVGPIGTLDDIPSFSLSRGT